MHNLKGGKIPGLPSTMELLGPLEKVYISKAANIKEAAIFNRFNLRLPSGEQIFSAKEGF